MQPRIHAITLAVSDLDRALKFYRDGLGLSTKGIFGTEFAGDDRNPAGAVVMFNLQGGVILALWPRSELAKDANVPFAPQKTGEFSIGHAVADRKAVDELLARAKAAGATVTDAGHERPWGIYSGYSAIRTATCGRSCGIRRSTCPRHRAPDYARSRRHL